MNDIAESFVWWLWQTRRFNGTAARARGVDVIFPGWPSSAAGPDFRDAVVAQPDGTITQGDVEIHVQSSDWNGHGHHTDPSYDHVILHVVLHEQDSFIARTAEGHILPTLALGSILVAPIDGLLRAFDGSRPRVIGCPFESIATGKVVEAVSAAGRKRFADKVHRLEGDIEAVGKEQALYLDLAESLGYSANKMAFRKIAEAIPFDLVAALSLFEAETLLLSAAGIATGDQLLFKFIDKPVLEVGELVTFRVRPSNSPATRLRGLARLVHRHKRGLASTIGECDPSSLWRLFAIEADITLVGRGRADDIVVNVALPFLAATRDFDSATELGRASSPPDNRWVRALRDKLARQGTVLRPYKALQHLGLLELALRYCRYDHCEACPLHGADAQARATAQDNEQSSDSGTRFVPSVVQTV